MLILDGVHCTSFKLGIVTKTRRIGRAELYKLNLASPLVKKLTDLDMSISKKLVNQELMKQRIKVLA